MVQHSDAEICGLLRIYNSAAGRWKKLGMPVVIGGDNLPSPVEIGLTDLANIGVPVAPLAPRGRHHCMNFTYNYVFDIQYVHQVLVQYFVQKSRILSLFWFWRKLEWCLSLAEISDLKIGFIM